MARQLSLFVIALGVLLATGSVARADDADLHADALAAMKKAAVFYRAKVASHGGYLYYYTPDLKRQWGEGEYGRESVFVEPPGTPTVGMGYLAAWHATGDRYYLDAARETAGALIAGQLKSGGWAQAIHFARPRRGRLGDYRKRAGGTWNHSSLDDNQTQSALRMLIRTDAALAFKDAEVHEAVTCGLTSLLKAQFPVGAFPQGWRGAVRQTQPAKAAYPAYDWKTDGRVKNYWDYYTLNDNLAGDVAEVLIEAHRTYKDDRYRDALTKLGDFLVAAQMPDPQPAWCQQYNYSMVPIWARKFEPPAITGAESQNVMRALIRIARYTGEAKYLAPLPRALAYFRRSLLPDGRVARFYELRTNKPLYMDSKYRLTYDDSEAPGHYSWKRPAGFDAIETQLEAARKALAEGNAGVPPPSPRRPSEPQVRRIIESLDANGRWVSTYDGESLRGGNKFARGFRYISSGTFAENLETLSAFVEGKKGE